MKRTAGHCDCKGEWRITQPGGYKHFGHVPGCPARAHWDAPKNPGKYSRFLLCGCPKPGPCRCEAEARRRAKFDEEARQRDEEKRADLRQEIQNSGDC